MALMASVSMRRNGPAQVIRTPLGRDGQTLSDSRIARYDGTNPIWDRFGQTTSTASGAKCSTSTIRYASPSVRPVRTGSISIQPLKSWDRCSISSSLKPTGNVAEMHRHRGGLGFSHTFRRLHHHVGHEQPRCTASCQPRALASDQDPSHQVAMTGCCGDGTGIGRP